MTKPITKVEVGFDLTDSPIGPFFRLDDPVRGVLDNTEYVLAGTIFVDITSYVRNVVIQRGRQADFDVYPSGAASVELNNHDRAFDPLFTDSPFYGNIVPRREIRISSNEEYVFWGWIEDWDLAYLPNNDSVVTAKANDALGFVAGQTLTGGTATSQLTGARINAILNDPQVNWATENRDIDTGASLLQADIIQPDTNALEYLQLVAASEPGALFIAKDGKITYRDRTVSLSSNNLVTLGGNNGIPFQNLQVIYGAELLYNNVTISRNNGGTVTAVDTGSQGDYGIRALTISGLLLANDTQLEDIAGVYVVRYSTPEYRVESLEIQLDKATTVQQNQVLGLELGSIVKFQFTPNNIAPEIVRYLEVIRIEHNVTMLNHYVTLGFQSLDYAPFVLDDPVFGKLDSGQLSW